MAEMTRDDAVRTATTEYLDSLDKANLPDAYTAQQELLEKTQMMFDFRNVQAPKDRKWKVPEELTSRQIASLMLALDNVVKIAFTGLGTDTTYDALAVYVTEGKGEGTYTLDENIRHEMAARYHYNICTRDLKEVDAILMRSAKRVEVCRERNLIAVGNGIFDYDKKVLLPFTPEKVFTSKSPVNYVPGAVSPVIHNNDDGTDWEVEEWMQELSDDDGVPELLWEVVGAVIRPNVVWDKSAWFYSESGNNGKGTLCELMRSLCGGSSVTLPISEMGKDFMLESLIGKSAIITDENDVGTYIDKAANLKAIITGDSLMINRKGLRPVTYSFKGFMVQCLNELPKIKDRSDSLYRRQLFVPFQKCFTGHARKYIKEEYLHRQDVLEYVLRRVLEMNYYELSEPVACVDTLDEYKVYNDPVKQFADDIFPKLVWDLVPFKFLYDLYQAWLRKNIPGGSALGRHAFTKAIAVEANNSPYWNCRDTAAVYRTGSKMDAPEMLIAEFDLKDWKNPGATGSNIMKMCMPVGLASTYKGIVRIAYPSEEESNVIED